MCEYCGKISSELENRKLKLSEELSSSVLKKEELSRELKTLAEKTDKSAVPISVQDFEAIESLKTIEVERDILRAQSREQKRLVAKHMKEVATSQKKIDLVKFWELAFSEQGLVKYVIRNILDFFNERSNYYLTTLTRGVLSIEFDELLQETIVNNGGTVFFDALSGGEKKKVSLAVMLSLNDLLVLSGKERSNVIFFDEIADSLDGEGIKGLYELIKDITKQKRVFVISHNDYFTSLIEDSSDKFTIIKRNNITKIG
jgi:DNA repair exonuclease SbcCD ATPase subunit